MMLLGWENNTSVRQKSAKLEEGNLSLGVRNPRFPTLSMKHWSPVSQCVNVCCCEYVALLFGLDWTRTFYWWIMV